MGLISLRSMKVAGPRMVGPGDPVPELENARNLKVLFDLRWVCKEGEEPAWLITQLAKAKAKAAGKQPEHKALAPPPLEPPAAADPGDTPDPPPPPPAVSSDKKPKGRKRGRGQ